MYGKQCACGYGKVSAKTRPTIDLVKCCLCRTPVLRSGWCDACQTYPINITPVRACRRGHHVNPDGWCSSCNDYVETRVEPMGAQWIDSGQVSQRLRKEHVHTLVMEIAAKLSGPGWPDVQVPLRRDMIPRRWKNAILRVTGTTPLGFDIVLPAGVAEPILNDVPF